MILKFKLWQKQQHITINLAKSDIALDIDSGNTMATKNQITHAVWIMEE